ncbi:hypothetical protein GGI23_004378 [Coemansia sp. RSA 2559]|nr:hypothetical protein GGI23_004378 [Coemansia sp. RSA 2559]KAJ2858750.1 hypothetical protein GGI22_003260 [Coemansia erecta]
MRFRPVILLVLLSFFVGLAAAWEKLDHEIFELYDDIKKHEATDDWYDLLGVKPKSSIEEINRSYRQLSKKYHPDKLSRLQASASEAEKKRFQRIGLVVNILRNSESRKRYNFFRKNGVPVWRGTGYLYRRWRPGFGTVVTGLVLFVSGMQYLFHHLSYWRAQERIRVIEEEHAKAGGKIKYRSATQTQQQMNRRVRRQQKKNIAGGGRASPTNAEEDSGFEGEEIDSSQINMVGVINPYAVQPASIKRVLVVSLPLAVLAAVGLVKKPEEVADESAEDDDELDVSENDHRQAVDDAIKSIENDDSFGADPEIKAKKAAKKAAKSQARRRRQPVV